MGSLHSVPVRDDVATEDVDVASSGAAAALSHDDNAMPASGREAAAVSRDAADDEGEYAESGMASAEGYNHPMLLADGDGEEGPWGEEEGARPSQPTLGQMAAQVQAQARAQARARGLDADIDLGVEPREPGICTPGTEHTGRWTTKEHETFLQALKLYGKEWKKVAAMVKTRTVVDTKSELARHDHADLADYYGNIMARLESLPQLHTREISKMQWLADLAVMQGERRAFATIKEALDDPDFHIPGHERCVELVERCAAAISGIIDPYMCSSERNGARNWGAADPTTMHAEEKWLWVLRRDFRSFGSSLKAHPSDRPLFPEESVVEALDRMGAEFKRRLEEKNVDPKSEDPSVLHEALTILTNFLCGEYPNDGANHVADMDFDEMPTNVHELNPHLLHPKFQMPRQHGLGLKGAESSVAVGYYDPMNSSLFCVLHNRVGIPITLSIVMAAVARRGILAWWRGHFIPATQGRHCSERNAAAHAAATQRDGFGHRRHGHAACAGIFRGRPMALAVVCGGELAAAARRRAAECE